jgi:hypothetical protein
VAVKRSWIKRKPPSPEEVRRKYGVPERREWMTRQPCMFCGKRPSVSAHTRTGGTGRKGDAETTAPMCTKCHDQYDGRTRPFGRASFLASIGWTRDAVDAYAALVELRWQAFVLVTSGTVAW